MLTLNDVGQGTILVLIIVLALVIFLFLDSFRLNSKRGRFRTPFRPLRFDQQQRPGLADVGQQLHAVMASSFEKQRVLSSSEYHVFAIVEAEITAQRSGYRVFAQTNLGEILKSNSQDAFHSINSKRVDILVVDRGGWPFLAVEYHGDGHYQGTAAARDTVKKEALRKAGVRYMEFCSSDTDDQIRSRLREQLASKTTTSVR